MSSLPADDQLYRNRGDWIFVNDLLQNPEYWFDEPHLNTQGAAEVTQRVTSEFVSRWRSSRKASTNDGVTLMTNAAVCNDHVYPPHSILKPFHSTHNSGDDDDEAP